jgi:hypothetical protein
MPDFAAPKETWNARFAREDYLFGRAPNAFLTSQAHRLAARQRALCVAGCEGRNSVWLAERGLDVTGLRPCKLRCMTNTHREEQQ